MEQGRTEERGLESSPATGSQALDGDAAAVAPAPAGAPGPRQRGRIAALDVARGFALLGIFLVNIEFFAAPLGLAIDPHPPAGGGVDVALWALISIFCEGKFYPLFSLLFGMGLVLQRQSIERAGGAFVPIYLRRTMLLAVIGLVHGLLLWYGDILFIYSLVALVVLAMSGLKGRTLLILGTASIVLALTVGAAVLGLSQAFTPEPPELSEEIAIDAEKGPFASLLHAMGQGVVQDPSSPLWMEAETLAMRDGPFLEAFAFRAMSFVMMLVSMTLMGGGFHILGMFLLGAGLIKLDLFGEQRRWLGRLLWIGPGAGLSLAALGVLSVSTIEGWAGVSLWAILNMSAGPFVSLGYLAWMHRLASSAPSSAPARALAAGGRMALTNYLGQTVIATALIYHWGLGLFGSLGWAERVAIVLAVFVAQLLFSLWWMGRFRFGPLEWAWRSATYLRAMPLRAKSVE